MSPPFLRTPFLFFSLQAGLILRFYLHITQLINTLERFYLFLYTSASSTHASTSLISQRSPNPTHTHTRNFDNMPGHATSCWIHSPHTDPGVKVGNMAKKPTPGPRTIANKCTCPLPGRPDGDAGPSGDKDQDGDGDGDDDGNQKEPRPHARMINGSGFYKPKPDKPKKPKNVVVAGMLMYTPMRDPPPPPCCASGGSGG